ncbi:uncharacterized protein LOC114295815 [Camellia sinensis]|uniref:uncharacterized protein LOC114295815 n=1 Tax=Camellia sinensis TaxID=4442 RepID=UPI0010363CBD|nr:uncharacterized protein LOC114295815 [Camellia sinensis]
MMVNDNGVKEETVLVSSTVPKRSRLSKGWRRKHAQSGAGSFSSSGVSDTSVGRPGEVQVSDQSQSRGSGGCFVCGQQGHGRRFCPLRVNSASVSKPSQTQSYPSSRGRYRYQKQVHPTLLFSSRIMDKFLKRKSTIVQDSSQSQETCGDSHIQDSSFEFAFTLHLMKNILGITNELSLALQKKNQDIVNAMTLVKVSKQRLQMMRDDESESLLTEVSSFCNKHEISIPNMDEIFVVSGRPRRKALQIANLHHYQVELFYTVLDMQLQELNNRFSEANTELLLCMACLNPSKSFFAFDKHKLIRLAEFYPYDFSATDLMVLDIQLQNYIVDMRLSEDFLELKGVGDLAIKLVETDKHVIYPLVYLLVKLALTLPVTTATMERSFSAMKYIKSNLRNRMGDQWMNVCLVTYIERDVFDSIDNEEIMQRFQNMKSRQGQL